MKVQSLDTALDILNYAPYLPPQAEKTITGLLRNNLLEVTMRTPYPIPEVLPVLQRYKTKVS